MMKTNQRKIGVILSYVVLILNTLISILYTPILTKYLGQSEYGLYSLIISIITYLTVLDLGLGNAIIIYTSRLKATGDKEKEHKLHGMIFIINIILGFIAVLVGIILYLNVSKMFGHTMTIEEINKAKVLMLILIFNLAMTFSLNIFGNIVTAYEKFVFGKVMKIIQILLAPILSIPILLLGYKSIALVIIVTLVNMFCLGLNTFYCLKELKIKLKFKSFDKRLLIEVFKYSSLIFISEIISKINWSVDQFILGAVVSTTAVAIYSVAAMLNQAYLSFSTAISSVLLPKITRMEEKHATAEDFTKIFIKTGRIQYILIALIITGFVLFGQNFIKLWVGTTYNDTYYIACILMIPVTIPLIQNTGLSILQAKNKYKFRTITYFFIALFNIIVSIPFAKIYGGIGVAIPTAVSLIVGNIIVMNIYYHRVIKIDIIKFWREIIKMTIPIIFVFILGIFINTTLHNDNLQIYFIKIGIYTLAYFAVS